MDIKMLDLKFKSNNKTLKVGKGKPYRLLNIEGIESGEFELFMTENTLGDGSNISHKRIKGRPISTEIEYTGNNKEAERRKLINLFNIHHDGELTVNYMGQEFKINYAVENFKSKINNLNEPLKFLVDMYCPNPFFKDLIETKEEVAIWRGSFEFPLELTSEGIELGYREPSLIVNVFNGGDVECGMKIQFKALATVVNPSLFNVNTREYFKVNKVMEAGEIITVTTHFQKKRVELNKNGVISNAFNWIEFQSTFLQLYVGDNLLRYNADDGIDNLEVAIYYTPQYLGV